MPATLRSLIDAAEARDLNIWLHHGASDNQSYLLAMHRGMVPADTVRRATPVVTCEICGDPVPLSCDNPDSRLYALCAECDAYRF